MVCSVIVTTYNDSSIIKRLVECNIENLECFDSFEVVFIDDCSEDDTVELLSAYMLGVNVNYQILVNRVNLGVAASRNRGIKAAIGEYVAFLDSDDLWHMKKLGIQLDLIKKTGADVVAASSAYICFKEFDVEDLRVVVQCGYGKVSFVRSLFVTPFVTPSVLMKASIAKNEKFPDHMRHAEDHNLWLRLIYKYKVIKLDCELVYVIKNESGVNDIGLSDNIYAASRVPAGLRPGHPFGAYFGFEFKF